MVLSTGVPSLADKRYFLSQMSSDASWKGMASTSLDSSLTTLFMGWVPAPRSSEKATPEGKKDPYPQFLQAPSVFHVERTAVRQPANPLHGSPQHEISRHNILCWGREIRSAKTGRQETSLS